MDWLSALDWTAIGFGAGTLAFVWLLVRAVTRLRKGRDYGDDTSVAPARAEAPEPELESKPKLKKRQKPSAKEAKPGLPAEARRELPADASARKLDREAEQRRLEQGLQKTRGGFVARLGSLLRGKPGFDETLFEQVEEVLLTADIGVKTSQELIDGIRTKLGKKEQTNTDAVWDYLRSKATAMVEKAGARALEPTGASPFIVLVVGVNGTGKTTTIGKLAAQLVRAGHKVLLAAGDTFRAAAAQQLAIWAERSGASVVSGKEGADPTSVIVEALRHAQAEGFDIVIADTAGRLHTKVSLMDELEKVRRAISKHVPGAPHETLLVLDSTTGQNAIAQAQMFREATAVSGIVLTKLDGTAKGGVLLGICNELQIPVLYVGVGEKVDDLRPFDPGAYVQALFAPEASIQAGRAGE